ncbi:MAG: response regulator [Cyanobacteria bacterium P01_H01_bin.21]
MIKKVLLITTDQSVCSTLHPWLTQHHYDVIFTTQGGDEGILLAVTQSPDLILIDTDLPVINGWQALQILKASTVTQKIPVIALVSADEDATKIQSSGCDACEFKPAEPESVLAKAKILLDSTPKILEASNSLLFPKYRPVAKSTSSVASSDVIYIDDSLLDSQTMADIVCGANYGYGNISQPLDAIPSLLETKPGLIFLDLVMPNTNGYELCAQIRRTSALRKTPIIIVTSNDGIIDRVRARFVGASGFISKPIEEKRVLKLLGKHLKPHTHQRSDQTERSKLLTAV